MPSTKSIAFVLASTDHGSLIVNRNDYNTNPENSDIYGVGWQLLNTSSCDQWEVSLALDILQTRQAYFGNGVIALDCGANIGVHTIEWAKLMHDWGTVTAFEAQERIFYALAGNIALNNTFNARAVLSAIGENNGFIGVPQPDYNHPSSYGSLEIRQRNTTENIGQNISYDEHSLKKIQMISIDSLNLNRLDFIKIDIEGMEIEALYGGENTINSYKPVILVEWLKNDWKSLRKTLTDWGYLILQAHQNFLAIHTSDPILNSINKFLARKKNRPMFIMAPMSRKGMIFSNYIANNYPNLIAAVDNNRQGTNMTEEIPYWSQKKFLSELHRHPDAVALDFSASTAGKLWVRNLCKNSGIEHCVWNFQSITLNNT